MINVEILLLADVRHGGPFSNLTDCCERQQGNKVAGFQETLNNFHGWSGRLAKQRVQNRADQPRVTWPTYHDISQSKIAQPGTCLAFGNEPRPRNFPLSFSRLQERRPRILISVVALQPRPSIAVRTGLFHEFLAPLKPCFRFFHSMFFVRRRGKLLMRVSRRSRMGREPYSWYFRWCWRNVNNIFMVENKFFSSGHCFFSFYRICHLFVELLLGFREQKVKVFRKEIDCLEFGLVSTRWILFLYKEIEWR